MLSSNAALLSRFGTNNANIIMLEGGSCLAAMESNMSTLQTIEINGSLVGILTIDHASRSFYFHSGVAPYHLLDGSRFTRPADARDAVRRLEAAHSLKSQQYRQEKGDRS